jgi:hypothetical protein
METMELPPAAVVADLLSGGTAEEGTLEELIETWSCGEEQEEAVTPCVAVALPPSPHGSSEPRGARLRGAVGLTVAPLLQPPAGPPRRRTAPRAAALAAAARVAAAAEAAAAEDDAIMKSDDEEEEAVGVGQGGEHRTWRRLQRNRLSGGGPGSFSAAAARNASRDRCSMPDAFCGCVCVRVCVPARIRSRAAP